MLNLLRHGERLHANHSLPARLMAVTHFVQKLTMERLLQSPRYGRLSVAYTPYIVLLVEQDRSPGELAERLGISKQACSKVVQELETLELIRRRVNPLDSRSSVLSLSAKGVQLVRNGIEIANDIQQQMADAFGAQRLPLLRGVFDRLCAAMDADLHTRATLIENIAAEKTGIRPLRLTVMLPWLSELFHHRLTASVDQARFTGLRTGIGQLLGVISEDSKRIQYIATLLGVSKQAVAATAAELEQRGYVTRMEDPEDRRQIIVSLSPRGRKLLMEVVASVDEMEAALRLTLGDADYALLDEAMTVFYSEMTEKHDSAGLLRARIEQISRQLMDELGVTGARALAQHLMTMTRGKA